MIGSVVTMTNGSTGSPPILLAAIQGAATALAEEG